MSVLKDYLIKILEQNGVDSFCNSSTHLDCSGIGCGECPYGSEENKQQLIKELQND